MFRWIGPRLELSSRQRTSWSRGPGINVCSRDGSVLKIAMKPVSSSFARVGRERVVQ
ncbi:hypothetical protein HBI56_083000 [Parastagonospora nodorum]|uniref:Uncharacterized protein n=1 Tax=Phaeosphaeria nodorum (strain SN15 / ATCC MYA-4574 / FGSC 10173) TaxID=321614 RepID=A0A7U2FG34_PHANO|nr:hypothetical protein HBH56_103590 [Parastagonospora nodorum]QRD04620.1 hypothetical protein JI435_421490 [Parastagonospora nodorum SN15]KAH3929458.1 hypothetical protein HBH54_126840 [Parastagonospora nodorum]KAH3951420.1 hypothetical protein HBH53_060860 [Parastagonospora nodorum]KAH3975651.1 hypothetical protein HBH52_126010 [Parastagonospora nodorum]